MGSFKVLFKPTVEKDLERLSKDAAARAMARAAALAENPFPANAVSSQAQKSYIGFGWAIIVSSTKSIQRSK